jgi:hypothetical protein
LLELVLPELVLPLEHALLVVDLLELCFALEHALLVVDLLELGLFVHALWVAASAATLQPAKKGL